MMSKTRPERLGGSPKGAGKVAAAPAAPAEAEASSAAPSGDKTGRGELATKDRLIKLTGRTPGTIERMIRAGAPCVKRSNGKTDPWVFNTAEFIDYMCQQAAAAAGGEGRELSFEAAKRKDKEIQAAVRELDLLERQGKLVSLDDVRQQLRSALTNTRSRMLAVSSQVMGLSPQQLRDLNDAINDALGDISEKLSQEYDADAGRELTQH